MYPHFTNCFLSWFAWWGWMKEEKDVLHYLVEGFLGCSHCFIYALPHQRPSYLVAKNLIGQQRKQNQVLTFLGGIETEQ